MGMGLQVVTHLASIQRLKSEGQEESEQIRRAKQQNQAGIYDNRLTESRAGSGCYGSTRQQSGTIQGLVWGENICDIKQHSQATSE